MRLRNAVFCTVVLSLTLAAQTAKPTATKSGAARVNSAAALPARGTVESFLRHMFGFNPNATWTLRSITPSKAKGVAEVQFELTNAKSGAGAQTLTLHVLPDRRYAVVGALMPFPGGAPAQGLPSEAAVASFIRSQIGEGGGSDWRVEEIKASRARGVAEVTALGRTPQGQRMARVYVPAGSQFALGGELIPFGADPFAANRAVLDKGKGAAKGPAGAAVTLVEFSDLQCPACKSAQPVIDKLLLQNPDVRFVFMHFPLESVHPWAFRGAAYAECVSRMKGAEVWNFIEAVYANQSEISAQDADARLGEIAAELGADAAAVKTCADDPQTKARIWTSQQLGHELEITGTPTLFINGRRVASVTGTPFEMLQAMVDVARKEATKR